MGIKQVIQRWLGIAASTSAQQTMQEKLGSNSSSFGSMHTPTNPTKRSTARYNDSVVIDDTLSTLPITLTIHNGLGGKAVVFTQYDALSDRVTRTKYVVPDSAEFGHELSNIIAIETLRQ